MASSKGDVGAERLSAKVGEFFDHAIRIIEYHGGDVVKFLGDALLVVFQADPVSEHHLDGSSPPNSDLSRSDFPSADELSGTSRRNGVLVRKAVDCGLELLARLSNFSINLSQEAYPCRVSTPSPTPDDPQQLNRQDSDDSSTIAGSQIGSGYSKSQWNGSSGSYGSYNNYNNGTISSASGHQFLTIPNRSTTNIGSSSSSNNSNGVNFNGPRRSSLPNTGSSSPVLPSRFASGNNLDVAGGFKKRDEANFSSSRPGSTTSRQTRAGAFFASARQFFSHSNTNDRQGVLSGEMSEDSHELQLHLALSAGAISNIIIGDIGSEDGYANLLEEGTGRLEYAICGEQMAIIDEALSMARAGELTITESAWKFLAKDSGDKSSTKDFSEKLYPKPELRRNCFILRNTQTANTSDIPRRIRNEKLLNKHVESNPHYYKYINKSAIHRLQLYPKSNFPAQFRTVTILFVSLGDVKPWTAEGLATCQKAIFQVHKVTSEYEGFIQQFAVDDKGATILCAYGLPFPRSHEREAVFAAKSAWVIRRRLLAVGIRAFKISLATGVIFTSMIGNEFRRDPAIVGDTIVIAVRMLKFNYATEAVVCDDATKEACTSDHDGMCEFEEMGDEYVKGKIHPIKVWRLVHFGAKKPNRKPTDIMVDETIGYEPERYKVEKYIENWQKEPTNHAIVVSGPRGSGKSMFYQQIFQIADKNKFQVCSAASAEVEKNTEYYLCKYMLLGLLDIMKMNKIPYSTKRSESDHTSDEGPRQLPLPQPQPQPQPQHQRRRSLHDVCTPQHFRQRSQPLPVNPFVLAHSITESTIAASTSSLSESTITDTSSITPTALDEPFPGFLSHFGPSVRSSVASNSPWDMILSPNTSQFGEPSKRSSSYVTKIKELISVSLEKMGESEGAIHTLHDIISVLSSDYSAPALTNRDNEILTDFIVRMLNYACGYVKIILMFEDVQWCDKKSMNIIKLIHERCPAIMVVIFSRPNRDYDYKDEHMIKSKTMLKINLEGLKRREIEIALLKTFEDNGVKKIHPDVVDLVQEKTKGNPKFVKNMTELLKDFSHVNIVDGELLNTGLDSAKTSLKSMEEMLVKQDRTKLTRMQFDRMNAGFQRFLKIASCLGSQFSLAEVEAVEPLASMMGEERKQDTTYQGWISEQDRFKFLCLATEQLTNVQFSSDPEQFVVMNTQYMFGSCSTAMDIYELIPYEERVSYHSRMGQFYESFREPSLMSDLLPLITRHYLRTDNTKKKIAYLQEISAFDLKSNMLMDATQSLTQLIHILDTVRGATLMVSQEDLADIYGMNGECLSKRMKIEEAEPALLDSLARYGIHWPRTEQQFRVALFMEKAKFMFHYHGVSSPSLNQSRAPKAKVDSKTQVTLQRIIRVLGCLQSIYYWKTDPNSAMLSILYSLNYSRKLGLPSSEQTISLGRYALMMYFKGNKSACKEYIIRAENANKENSSSEGTEGMLSSIQGYIDYCEGDSQSGHQYLQAAINESKSFGVVSNMASFYQSVILKCTYRMWEGSFNQYPEDSALLRAMSAVAIQNGDTEGEILFAIPTLANLLLQDRIRDAESWVVLIEKFIMPKARLMNMLAIHGMLSYYYAKTGKFSKSPLYAELLAEQLPQQGIAAHPFPLMGCVFTVMAMYEMIDMHGALSSNKSYEPADTPLCSNKAEQILRPIIDWLSQDPFQTVAQTYVVLSEAFKCFITHGHNREGIQRLQRGWERLGPSLEQVPFVRAYFLAKLGRHAVSLKERDKYYSEAYELFTSMSIDWTLWLSDPLHVWSPPKIAGSKEQSFAVGAIPTPS